MFGLGSWPGLHTLQGQSLLSSAYRSSGAGAPMACLPMHRFLRMDALGTGQRLQPPTTIKGGPPPLAVRLRAGDSAEDSRKARPCREPFDLLGLARASCREGIIKRRVETGPPRSMYYRAVGPSRWLTSQTHFDSNHGSRYASSTGPTMSSRPST